MSIEATTAPLVAISVLNWNGWEDTIECLESVRRLDYPNYLTVVVDNGSWNGSADRIRAWAEANLGPGHVVADYSRETALAGGNPETEQALDRAPSAARLVLIRNEDNLGFTGGNNTAIHYTLQRTIAAGYVFLLNNDAEAEPSCVSELVRVAQRTGAGLVGAQIRNKGQEKPGSYAWALGSPVARELFYPLLKKPHQRPLFKNSSAPCFAVCGAAALILGTALRDLHAASRRYLDPALFMYHDEIEFGAAIQKAGYSACIAEKAIVCHTEAGGAPPKPLVHYYTSRNRIILAKRLLPRWLRVLFHAWNTVHTAAHISKLLASRRPQSARAVTHGLMDGYRGVAGMWKDHDDKAKGRPSPCPNAEPILRRTN